MTPSKLNLLQPLACSNFINIEELNPVYFTLMPMCLSLSYNFTTSHL